MDQNAINLKQNKTMEEGESDESWTIFSLLSLKNKNISITELKIYSSFYVDAKKPRFRHFGDNQSIKNINIAIGVLRFLHILYTPET